MTELSKSIENACNVFLQSYLGSLESYSRQAHGDVSAIFDAQKRGLSLQKWAEFNSDRFGIESSSLADFRKPRLRVALDHQAKILDVFRRIRVVMTQQHATEDSRGRVADSLEYVLSNAEAEGASFEDVQGALNEVVFSVALTSHPTNPLSPEFTMASSAIVDALGSGDKERFDDLMKSFIGCEPYASQRKTQKQEVDLGLHRMEKIYDAVDLMHDRLQGIIADSNYANLKLPEVLCRPAVWLAGDGDGNPKMDEESLRYNVEIFKKKIKEKYRAEMHKIGIYIDFPETPEEFIAALESEKLGKSASQVEGIEMLIKKVKIFGYHYAKIDVRHASDDFMTVVTALLKKIGELTEDEIASDEKLLKCLGNKDVVEKIAALDYKNEEFGADTDVVRRIFGRFKLIAQNPEMFEKLIIAEFSKPEHTSAVLLMLKASGNVVCQPGASLVVVPLAESRDDLRSLGDVIAGTMKQSAYLEHIKASKKISFMIARSDTVRRGGVGAQIAQKEAVINSIVGIVEVLLESGEDLEGYEIMPYNGGGHAGQRGGGRIRELASVYGRYAMEALKTLREKYPSDSANIDKIKISAPIFTSQGHHSDLLFDGGVAGAENEVAAETMGAFVAQGLHGAMRKRGCIADKEVDCPEYFEIDADAAHLEAEKVLHEISECAYDYYHKHSGKERGAIVEGDIATPPVAKFFKERLIGLLASVKVNNQSSRASVKGAKDNPSGGQMSIKKTAGGEKISLVDQRSIGVAKALSTLRLNFISWIGWAQGMEEAVEKHGGDVLHKTYLASKSFRDGMRTSAFALCMDDFDLAWLASMGDEPRPDFMETQRRASSYHQKMKEGRHDEVTHKESFAFLEAESQRTKALIFKAMTGEEMSQYDDLADLFPEVKEEIAQKNIDGAYAAQMHARLCYACTQESSENIDPAQLAKLLQASYCAVNSCNADNVLSAGLDRTKGKSRVASVATVEQFSSADQVPDEVTPTYASLQAEGATKKRWALSQDVDAELRQALDEFERGESSVSMTSSLESASKYGYEEPSNSKRKTEKQGAANPDFKRRRKMQSKSSFADMLVKSCGKDLGLEMEASLSSVPSEVVYGGGLGSSPTFHSLSPVQTQTQERS